MPKYISFKQILKGMNKIAHTNPNCLDPKHCYSHNSIEPVKMKPKYYRLKKVFAV